MKKDNQAQTSPKKKHFVFLKNVLFKKGTQTCFYGPRTEKLSRSKKRELKKNIDFHTQEGRGEKK